MKNNKIKICKKTVLKYVTDKDLKILIIKYFKNIKYYLHCYIKITQLIYESNKNTIFIKDFFYKFQNYYLNIDKINIVQNKLSLNPSIDEKIDFIIENYIKIFSLDFQILKNTNNLDIVYEYNKLQIRLFLEAKNIILKFFPLKLNTIIEIFNKFRKPIYEYIKIN